MNETSRIGELRELRTLFGPRASEGSNKVLGIAEAIRRSVQPGMTVHLGYEAGAAACEIVRQFWSRDPKFTLVMGGTAGTFAPVMIHGGLVRKLIFTSGADWYPTPGVNPVIQRAYSEGVVELENWTTLSLVHRLMAGSMGLPFMPTRSISGSDIANDNERSFRTVEDPFGSGRKVGLVQSLNPDISIIHGCAADQYGNTIVVPASLTYFHGTKASRNGAIVTVEKLVSTDFIRNHSTLVKIPGYMVKSVSVAPLGAHPQGLNLPMLPEMKSYEQDSDFMQQAGLASKKKGTFDEWIEHWILGCASHDEYLAKLGPDKISLLEGKADSARWRNELETAVGSIAATQGFTPTEMMVVAASREIRNRIKEGRHKLLFAGIGISLLASALAYYQLLEEGYNIDLIGGGTIGFSPRPGHLLSGGAANQATAKMLCDQSEVLGIGVGGEFSNCLAVMGAAQIDVRGNLNSTKTGEGTYLGGSGGANDIASTAADILVVARQSPRRFLRKVDYVTSPGDRVGTLVSDLAVYRRGEDGLTLTAYIARQGQSPDDALRVIRENCGWDLAIALRLTKIADPTSRELSLMRMLDPRREFLGKGA
ncbi:MAG: hypothetical protein HY675_23315 [Chloroflexi bacterium]|nr:hypothetical protein [Chloroflexota bacterium]